MLETHNNFIVGENNQIFSVNSGDLKFAEQPITMVLVGIGFHQWCFFAHVLVFFWVNALIKY